MLYSNIFYTEKNMIIFHYLTIIPNSNIINNTKFIYHSANCFKARTKRTNNNILFITKQHLTNTFPLPNRHSKPNYPVGAPVRKTTRKPHRNRKPKRPTCNLGHIRIMHTSTNKPEPKKLD